MIDLTNKEVGATIDLIMRRDGLVAIPRGAIRIDGSSQSREQPVFRLDFSARQVLLKNKADGEEYIIGEITGIHLAEVNTPSVIIGLKIPICGLNL